VTDWAAVRREFPALAEWTYLNTATFGQLPSRAVEAVNRHFAHRDELACYDFLDWFDDANRVRESIARLVHCEAADVAFIQNASTALSLLVSALDWRPGDRIVALAGEFPNNIYQPAVLEARGVEFVETEWEQFYDSVNERTRMVVMSTVNYTTGFRAPLDEIGRFLAARGIVWYLDGTQSVGALELDLGRVQPHAMAVHAYKWLLSPTGAGFMYVRPDVRERVQPVVVGWRSDRRWREVDNLHHGAPEFVESAEKYEGGMLQFPLIFAMGASVDFINGIGAYEIERRVSELAAGVREICSRHGGELRRGHYDSPIVSAYFPGVNASDLNRRLKERRVLVSARHGNLRVSTHFYNDERDLAAFDEGLRAALS
jgi:selenocysteine lyase/cysteine desulfurase